MTKLFKTLYFKNDNQYFEIDTINFKADKVEM